MLSETGKDLQHSCYGSAARAIRASAQEHPACAALMQNPAVVPARGGTWLAPEATDSGFAPLPKNSAGTDCVAAAAPVLEVISVSDLNCCTAVGRSASVSRVTTTRATPDGPVALRGSSHRRSQSPPHRQNSKLLAAAWHAETARSRLTARSAAERLTLRLSAPSFQLRISEAHCIAIMALSTIGTWRQRPVANPPGKPSIKVKIFCPVPHTQVAAVVYKNA